MFVLENVTHYYSQGSQHLPAVNNISLKINKGEWIAVIGANGSGKSTLARHLNGLLLPNTGCVTVNGLSTADESTLALIRRQVGCVLQNPDNQIVGNSVEEDIAFGPENAGIIPAEIRRRITASLELVGLSGSEKRDPYRLSGGQKQRVAIAGALAMEPQAIVLDEATSMLDPEGCKEVLAILQKLHQSGLTIIMITHNMAEVTLADRAVVLKKGELVADNTPKSIFAQVQLQEAWGLEIPIINQIGNLLAVGGLSKDLSSIMSLEEMVELLCRLN
ncbi:MAG: energy-coupling factor transporter ATPase [Clostridia bacterium]|nr:energy-coupling factor transporter ATPase [Clostridia bacterium]